MMTGVKAIILIGGPNKGQRFRPLSLDAPKYAFPVGGQTIIEHLIESCLELEELTEIILLGFYQQDEMLSQTNLQKLVQRFVARDRRCPSIRYLQEFTRMGTAGGLYHFRDQIRHGGPNMFLVVNGDVCGDFDLKSMLAQHKQVSQDKPNHLKPYLTVMTTEASREESLHYGCIVEDPETHVIKHYVEKPSTFVSNLISCGVYFCNLKLLDKLEEAMKRKRDGLSTLDNSFSFYSANQLHDHPDYLSLELDILQESQSQPYCYSYKTHGSWWCQVKTPASAIYANRQYLKSWTEKMRSNKKPGENGNQMGCTVIGDVFFHPTATVDPSAVIGPNVSVMKNCVIGVGVRIKESIILQDATIDAHSLVLYSVVGRNCNIGPWVRIEGTPSDPDPNQKFAIVKNLPLYNSKDQLNPSISVLGCSVDVPRETVIVNTIVSPNKELSRSYRNKIVL